MIGTRGRTVAELWRIALQIRGQGQVRSRKNSNDIRRDAVNRELQSDGFLKRMVSCVKGTDELDQGEIRKLLNSIDAEAWKKMLNKLTSGVGSFAGRLGSFAENTPGHTLLCDLFLYCVEDDLFEHLDVTIDWLDDLEQTINADLASFKKNNKALLRACRRNHLDAVDALLKGGFMIETQVLKIGDGCREDVSRSWKWWVGDPMNMKDKDLMLELSRLEAMAKPVYLISQYNRNPTVHDPIYRALQIINKCYEIAGRRMSHINQIEVIRNSLKDFVLEMLHLCENSEEVETFLNKDDNLCGISLKGTMLLPRINQAMHLHFKEFVNHDYCQQVTRDTFYRQTPFKNRGDGNIALIGRIMVQIVKTPFVCLLHSLTKAARIAVYSNAENGGRGQAEELPLQNMG